MLMKVIELISDQTKINFPEESNKDLQKVV